jgi:hypothetical protein
MLLPLEADGVVELGGDVDCARADDSISPLSAVVNNSFFSIGETSMHVCFVESLGHGFCLGSQEPGHTLSTFELHTAFRMELRAQCRTRFAKASFNGAKILCDEIEGIFWEARVTGDLSWCCLRRLESRNRVIQPQIVATVP